MFFAFILLLVVNAVSLSTVLFQCATAKRSNQQRKTQKSHKSTRKSRKSSRSGRSGRSTSTRSGKSSRSSKSGKSSRSGKSKSGKSYKLKSNPKSSGNRKVQAAILADQKAAQDAVNPSLKELASDKKESSHKVSYTNVRVIPHEMSFSSIGGLKHVRVKNSTGKRIAFMVKCSDNMLFSINPVFGTIETDRDAQINILRENGEAKHDKLVIITAAHPDKKKTAEQTFSDLHHTNSQNYNINVVPLLTQ